MIKSLFVQAATRLHIAIRSRRHATMGAGAIRSRSHVSERRLKIRKLACGRCADVVCLLCACTTQVVSHNATPILDCDLVSCDKCVGCM